jgi:tRNA A-37 threonylcarbamoyl transferase component Bud32
MNQPSWIGQTLSGRYKIEAMLGQGGMSAVYKATDPNLKRVVAIKLIHPHLSSDISFVQRFESEAAAVASLRHPNIVQVYDFNNDNGTYYMVLEFIAGETLQERMKRLVESGRQLSLEETMKFGSNVADAVGYANERGIVHRDIKPANIMLDVQGQAILMDFGIVKIMGGESHTTTGALVGTARYMSPEIIRGTSPDHRADIYSLGVTLFEMLSGRPPFVSDSAMTLMMMHLNDPVPDVREFRSDVPTEIKRIIEKCLAKERDDRYQSGAELSRDLKSAFDKKSVSQTMKMAKKPEKETPPIVVPVPQASYTPPPPAYSTGSTGQAAAPKKSDWKLLGGIGLALIVCIFATLFCIVPAVRNNNNNNNNNVSATQTALANIEVTQTPIIILETETPANTATPELTATPENPYVAITSITLENNKYIVNYEVGNFGEQSYHVHIFFNSILPVNAGSPGSGPWKLTYGNYGPSPFTEYGPANRPLGATQMCALVANPNHSIILDTGNCVDLP